MSRTVNCERELRSKKSEIRELIRYRQNTRQFPSRGNRIRSGGIHLVCQFSIIREVTTPMEFNQDQNEPIKGNDGLSFNPAKVPFVSLFGVLIAKWNQPSVCRNKETAAKRLIDWSCMQFQPSYCRLFTLAVFHRFERSNQQSIELNHEERGK